MWVIQDGLCDNPGWHATEEYHQQAKGMDTKLQGALFQRAAKESSVRRHMTRAALRNVGASHGSVPGRRHDPWVESLKPCSLDILFLLLVLGEGLFILGF